MNNGCVIHFAAQVPIICFCFRFRFGSHSFPVAYFIVPSSSSTGAPPAHLYSTPVQLTSMMQEMHLFSLTIPHRSYTTIVYMYLYTIYVYSEHIWLNRAFIDSLQRSPFRPSNSISYHEFHINNTCTMYGMGCLLYSVLLRSACLHIVRLLSEGHIESFVVIS